MAALARGCDSSSFFWAASSLCGQSRLALLAVIAVIVNQPPSSSASSPVIEGDYRKFYVTEELPPTTIVCNLVVELGLKSKYDPAVVERLRFSFLTHPPFDRPYFSIDEKTGVIRTTRRIDRERVCPSVSSRTGGSHSQTGASSGGGGSATGGGLGSECLAQFDVAIKPIEFFQIVKIAVEIMDVNDNAPEFPTGHTHHRIAESADPESSGIVVPAAIDPDAGRNGIRMYELQSPTDKFLLDVRETADGGTDLRLLLREPLDRELEDRYEVVVVAIDGGVEPKSGSTILNITVLDVNDNAPIFDNDTYEVHVPENIPGGTVIARVHARDADLEANGAITYSFTPQTEQRHGRLFGIRPDTGKIYVKADPGVTVDRETSFVHLLSVTATDHGADPLSAHATVVVHVDDVNDNAPSISVNTLTVDGQAEVAENAPPGTFVAYASVLDADAGDNGHFRCGVMTQPSSHGIGSSESSRFALRQQSFAATEYQLVTTATFDREQRDRYDVTITCADHGSPSLTSSALVRVRVRDENDNAPQFSKDIYEFEIDENCAIGTAVGHVSATDADNGPNGEIEYRLHANADTAQSGIAVGKLLRINARTGHIFTRDEVDREVLMTSPDEPIEFTVTAVDHGGGSAHASSGRTATATVKLFINDLNDQSPRFDREHYEFYVTENQPVGTFVGRVRAVDLDLPPNDHVVYSIVAATKDAGMTSPNQFAFDVDPETGNVTTRETLDRERKPDYVFDVLARGRFGSLPAFSASACVTVHVTDVNDHRPLFTNPLWNNHTISVSNMAPVGYVFTRLRAVDLDFGQNANLTYRIVSGNHRNTFSLHPVTGALSVAADLGNIVFEDFQLKLAVYDGGQPVLSDDAELRIVVSRDIVHQTPAIVSRADLTRMYGGVLASENTAVVLAATLAAILTAVAAIAVTICVIRWRGHSRRVFRCSGSAQLDNGGHKNSSGNNGIMDGKSATPAAVWGSPGFGGGATDATRSNGRVRPVDYVGNVNGPLQTACVRLHQSPLRGANVSGRAAVTSPSPLDGMATSSTVATEIDRLFGSKQCLFDGDATTAESRQAASSHVNAPVNGMCAVDMRDSPSVGLRHGSADSGMTAAETTGFTSSPSHRYSTKLEAEIGNPINKPVVVFVKDQLQQDYERFSPGSTSNTDSGRGNSDYGEELSPPIGCSLTHEANNCISSVDTVRHLADLSGRRTPLTSSPTIAADSTKLFVGSPRTACRSSPFPTSAAGMSMSLSNSLSASQRRAGTSHHVDHYHTLATFSSAKRNTPVITSLADVSSSSSLPMTGNSGAVTMPTMPPSSAALKYYDFSKFGDSSSIAAVMVAGSPKRYATNVGGVRGQHHRQHRGRVKMTETVSDMNLAHHLLNGPRPAEQSIYGTIDRNITTANRRHPMAKYGGVTAITDSDRGSLETSAQLGKSLQALPDTIVCNRKTAK